MTISDRYADREWHVFRAPSQRETKAVDDFKAAGSADAFTPVEKRYSVRAHLSADAKPRTHAVLTGYVIARAVRRPATAKRVGPYVGSITNGEVATLRSLDGREVNKPGHGNKRSLQVGDNVTVTKGTFAACQARVTAIRRTKVNLVTWMFGRECYYVASLEDVQRLVAE